MDYTAPVKDLRLALEGAAEINRLAPYFPAYSEDILGAVLTEASKFSEEVLAPLNRVGDLDGAKLENGVVRSSPGFKEAYDTYREGGWLGLSLPEEVGGAGLPLALGMAVGEAVSAANLAWGLCPLLSHGGIEALMAHGSEDLKSRYLPRVVSAEWPMTMNLTEPQAGSDVGALRTKATPQGDGSYRIQGQKIYITWGEHDMAENIVHLVLARLPDAPAGSKGISLFLVPKFLPNDDGSLGPRNDVRAIGLEHKLGIHGSPTCTMAFGADDGAIGWLVGAENKGLACMFTMMNAARLQVGVEGVAVSERAYQKALAYALERRQGKAPGDAGEGPSRIIEHPDVRRMLTDMRAKIEAGRAICLMTAAAADEAGHGGDPDTRARAKRREDILTPIAKAWCSDRANEITSTGVQIHGGMGFVEETGAAQFMRDARICGIYEGTNGIQAIDLAGRKLALANGAALSELVADIRRTAAEAQAATGALAEAGERLNAGADAMERSGAWVRNTMSAELERGLAAATRFLKLAGDVVAGWCLVKNALYAQKAYTDTPEYAAEKARLAAYFAQTDLAMAPALEGALQAGDPIALTLGDDALAVR